MGGSYLSNAGVFLVETLFGIYIIAVMLRFILQVVRADFYNPLCQAIVTVTNPPLRPMRRYIPSVSNLDSASIVLMLCLQLLGSWLVAAMIGFMPSVPSLVLIAIAELISKAIYIYLFAIFIQIVIGWVAPGTYNPAIGLINTITTPLLRPARRILPPFGGAIDFSPMLVVVALMLAQMLIVAPLRDLGRALM